MPLAACSEAVRLFCLFFLAKRMLGGPSWAGRSPGEPPKDGGAKPLWGFLLCPLWGPCVVPLAASAAFVAVGALGRRPACVAGGGADAKRWGNPAGVPFTRCVNFSMAVGCSQGAEFYSFKQSINVLELKIAKKTM